MALRTRTKVIITVLVGIFVCVILLYDFSSDRELKAELRPLYSIEDPAFLRAANHLLGHPFLPGHYTETLLNGDQIFPSMLDAIESAEKTITFETYIYWDGEVGKKFTLALSEKAKAGIKVLVLLDWVGTKIDKTMIKQMKDAGVRLEQYHAIPWFSLRTLNNRTHRKIMVVDGKVGFTGGAGVADHWLGNAESKEHWRDTHFRFTGPAVAQIQGVFADNWLSTTGDLVYGEDFFPGMSNNGDQLAQVIKSSPQEGAETTRLMYLLSIASARRTILMSNAYFVPDDLSIKTMISAARRGVKIKIIAPGEITDTKVVRSASRSRWGELLRAGVEFYEYQPTMFHCKVMVVDDIWSSVGSTNFDNRSFRLNDEVNLNVYDRAFAAEQTKIFYNDLKECDQITLPEWENRPKWERFKDWFWGLLHHQL